MDNPITPTHSPWCGYWTKNYIPPPPPSLPPSPPPLPTMSHFLVTGSWFITSIDYDPFATVIGKNGAIIWSNAYYIDSDRYGYMYGADIVADNVICCGSIYSGGYGCMFVMKLNKSDGSIIWQSVFISLPSSVDEMLLNTCIVADGGCVSVGRAYVINGYKIFIIKHNSAGTVLWSKNISTGSSTWDVAFDILELSDNSLIITGHTRGLSEVTNKARAFLMKISHSGELIWFTKYGDFTTNNQCGFNSVIQTTDAGFLAIGYALEATGTYPYRILILKTSSTGIIEWKTYIPASAALGDRNGYKIVEISNGYLFVGFHPNKTILSKINLDGILQWSKTMTDDDFEDLGYSNFSGLDIDGSGIALAALVNKIVEDYSTTSIIYMNYSGEIAGCPYIHDGTMATISESITAGALTPNLVDTTIAIKSDSILISPRVYNSYEFCTFGNYFARRFDAITSCSALAPYCVKLFTM